MKLKHHVCPFPHHDNVRVDSDAGDQRVHPRGPQAYRVRVPRHPSHWAGAKVGGGKIVVVLRDSRKTSQFWQCVHPRQSDDSNNSDYADIADSSDNASKRTVTRLCKKR